MKIILLQDVRNLGKKSDVKEVSDGYARNFLFVNKLAEPATAGALKKLESTKAEHNKEESALREHLEVLARKISTTKIEFDLKADKSGALFGSVNKESILKALREHNLITKERVDVLELKHPIKEAGEYKVQIDLKKGVVADLTIIVKKIPR